MLEAAYPALGVPCELGWDHHTPSAGRNSRLLKLSTAESADKLAHLYHGLQKERRKTTRAKKEKLDVAQMIKLVMMANFQ